MKNKIMHHTLFGYVFYPITYKNQKYVVEITDTFGSRYIDIYEYKEKKRFFHGYKGEKLLSYETAGFEYRRDDFSDGFTLSVDSDDFKKNYPSILKNIMESMEMRLVKKESGKVKAWDGVIR